MNLNIPQLTSSGQTVLYVSTEPPNKKAKIDNSDQEEEQNEITDPLDVALQQKYVDQGPKATDDITTDPIPPVLANILNIWFRSIFTNEEICAKLLLARRPSNATALKPIMINKEVYRSLSREDKERDRPLKCVANAVCKGSQPLVSLWCALTQGESKIQEFEKHQNSVNLPLPDGSVLPVTEIVGWLDLALQLLGIANIQISQKRRLDLRYKLAISAKDLANHSQPFTDFLFGNNIKDDHASAIKNFKLTHSVTKKNSPHKCGSFSHRGGSRGRHGHHGERCSNHNFHSQHQHHHWHGQNHGPRPGQHNQQRNSNPRGGGRPGS